jgi:hypothetical protein
MARFLFQNESKYEPDYVVKITDRVHFSYKIYFTPIMNNETVILEKILHTVIHVPSCSELCVDSKTRHSFLEKLKTLLYVMGFAVR